VTSLERTGPDYQALFESVPASYLILDPEWVIVAASDAYLRDTLKVREEIVGRFIFDVFPENPDDQAANAGANMRASLDRVGHDLVPDTMAVQKHDVLRPETAGGEFETRYWSPVNSPMLDSGGKLAYIIHQVENVTEYVRLKEQETEHLELTTRLPRGTRRMEADVMSRARELQELNRKLRDADTAKNEFLSRVSHELRTPLNAVLGFGELLSFSDISAEHRDWVMMILAAAQHLLQLLNEVLDISRIEAGRLTLSVEPVLAGLVIADALDMVRPLAVRTGIRLDPAPESAQYVLADRQRLRQVLLNLLSNAIKYNHPTGTVTTAVQACPGGRLRIGITDSGQGISPEGLGKLFTPFERLDAAQAGIEGTGLGLTLSRQLIQAMGGEIGVSSNLGHGSTFWFELPAAEAATARRPVEPDTITASPCWYTTAKTVLYVEDMIENLRLVEEILKQRPSITIIPAMLGGVGLDLAREHHPDLILLDVHLPDINGGEVIRRLHADPATRAIPVVILSADATQHQIDRLLAAGAIAYVTKPIGVRHLLQTIDSAFSAAQPGAVLAGEIGNR
jgi:signal transduction histidine kinase/AmiR/NasT family two-component response regulator